jgi:ketosteroid isomerase-like protein
VTEDRRIPLIEGAIKAFNDEDVGALLAFIHPEVISRVAEGLGNPGTHEGIEGFGAMMADWAEAWSSNKVELDEVEFVNEDVALVHVSQSLVGAGSGIPVGMTNTFLIGFEGDRAIRFEIHPERESAVQAL